MATGNEELMRELAGLNTPYQPANPSSLAFQQRAAMLGQSGTGLGNASVARNALSGLSQGPIAQPAAQMQLPGLAAAEGTGLAAAEGNAARAGLLSRVGGVGGLTKGLGYGLGGQVVGGGIEKFGIDPNDPTGLRSNSARVLGETAKYGGMGMAAGPIGGLAGGTFGALKGGYDNLRAIGKNPHESENKQNLYIQGLIDASTTDKKERTQIANKYTTLMVLAKTPEEKAAIGQKFAADLTSQIGTGQQLSESKASIEKQALAAQIAAQQFIKPITQQMQQSSRAQANLINQLGSQLPPEYQALAQQHAADQVTGGDRMAAAYAMQLQSMPQIEAMRLQQQQVNQIAQQQYAQMLSGQGTGTAPGDLQAQIAAQLGG